MQHLSFCIWLITLSAMSPQSIPLVTRRRMSFCLEASGTLLVWIHRFLDTLLCLISCGDLKGGCFKEARQMSLYLTAYCGVSSVFLVTPAVTLNRWQDAMAGSGMASGSPLLLLAQAWPRSSCGAHLRASWVQCQQDDASPDRQ